jgi:hypothetical protein
MPSAWPTLKRGNRYQKTFTFGFTGGTLAGCVATLMIKTRLSDPDSAALLIADSAGIGGLTLTDGTAPNTGVIDIDLADDATAALPAKRLFIGLQLLLPSGEAVEFDRAILTEGILVEPDVVRATA